MDRQKLIIDVQFNGVKRHIRLLDTPPDAARYEQVIQLSATRAKNTLYETMLYVDGMDMDEYEAKQLVVDILGSPIWRAKMLGTVHPMPHDTFWNIIFFIDQVQTSHYIVLNAKYGQKALYIESRAGGHPAFLAIERDSYPHEVARKIYEASGYTFSALTTANPTHYQATIGMTQAVTVDIDIISQSIACYLRELRQPEAQN